MTNQERINDLLTKLHTTGRKREVLRGRLGLGDAAKTLVVVEGGVKREGYVWCRITQPSGMSPRQVINRKVANTYGLAVWLREGLDGDLEVIEEDTSESIEYFRGHGSGNLPEHAPSHSYYGHDSVRIDPRQFTPLLTRPNTTPGLTVLVDPLVYPVNGATVVFDGGTLDLTSYVPSVAGYQRLVITALNMDTNTLTAFAGTASFVNLSSSTYNPFTRAQANAITVTGNVLTSCVVRLYTGQTRIRREDIVFDWRQWLVTGASLSFDSILTDSNGSVLSDSNGNVLTV